MTAAPRLAVPTPTGAPTADGCPLGEDVMLLGQWGRACTPAALVALSPFSPPLSILKDFPFNLFSTFNFINIQFHILPPFFFLNVFSVLSIFLLHDVRSLQNVPFYRDSSSLICTLLALCTLCFHS